MDFKQKLSNYAELIVKYGMNVQPDQYVRIQFEPVTTELARLVVQYSYQAGARFVESKLSDPMLTKIRIENSEDKYLEYLPKHLSTKFDEYIEEEIASCAILGSDDPDVFEDVDPEKFNKLRMANYQVAKKYREEAINQQKVQWSLAAASTEGWAVKVFPNDTPEQAVSKLWDTIFQICRVDQENFMELWEEHDVKLKKRCEYLDSLNIQELRFVGPGTDLTVGLSPKATFLGGRSKSNRGHLFEPNIPTEECFTTPDFRKTTGHVSATRSFRANGVLVKDLHMEFKDGVLVNSSASAGHDAFQTFYKSDPGASQLGEVALVGTDSPVFKSGLFFDKVLFDENAACHIAIGSAYKKCIIGGPALNQEELDEIGVNESSVHQDMMISSEDVDVFAKSYDSEEEVPLIQKGKFVDHLS